VWLNKPACSVHLQVIKVPSVEVASFPDLQSQLTLALPFTGTAMPSNIHLTSFYVGVFPGLPPC